MAKKGKTHKSTAKRLKVTKKGQVTRNAQRNKNNAHLRNKRKKRRAIVHKNLVLSSRKQTKKVRELINN